MSETAPQRDQLEMQKNNPDAIRIIMELYGVDEGIAMDLWHRFIGTVQKMKTIVSEQKTSQK